MPAIAEEMPSGNEHLLHRTKRSHGPNANQTRSATGSSAILLTLDLRGQGDHLNEQDRHQHERILVPGKEVFHDAALRRARKGRAYRARPGCYSIEIFLKSLKSLSIFPVPSTTLARGSSAMETGRPVSSRMRLSRFLRSAPPPVSTMPRSLISALNSGGVRSRATRMALMMVATHSPSDSRISESLTATVRGTPSIRLRPLISMLSGLSSG